MITQRRLLLLSLTTFLTAHVFAQPTSQETRVEPAPTANRPVVPETADTSLLGREKLTGDWGGARTDLEERGIAIDFAIWADLFKNVRGGINTEDMDLMHLESLTFSLDTETLFDLKGGTLFVDLQHIGGDNPSNNVGDWQWVSYLAADRRDEVAEFWYEQKLMDDTVRIKLGKIDACLEFDVSDVGNYFLNSSSSQSPTLPGLTAYPDGSFGIMGEWKPCDYFYVRAGVFDGNQQEGKTLGDDGARTVFSGPSDLLLVGEVGTSWKAGRLPGRATIGMTYHTGTFNRFDGNTDDGVAGGYLVVEQMLTKTCDDEEDCHGTSLFFRAGLTDGSSQDVRYHLGGGIVASGFCPHRPDDAMGAAFNLVGFSNDASANFAGDELNLDLFYRFQVTQYFSVTPDVQYVFNPSGDESLDDALALGVRFVMDF